MPWTTEQKIFIVEAYFRQKSIHASQLQFKERFGCREFPVHEAHFMLSGHVNPTNNIFWGSTPLSAKAITLCEVQYLGCHLQTWHHSGSRTTTSGLWRSTPSDMSRCLAKSVQHLLDGEESSESSSGSSRMMPPPTPQANRWHGYSSVSLTDWSAASVTRSGRRIHWTW